MNLKEFKSKYFTNNFYWVDENNFEKLQEIAFSVGCRWCTKDKKIIKWISEVSKDKFPHNNLAFRTTLENDNITQCQAEPFLSYKEEATDFDKMLKDYKNIF